MNTNTIELLTRINTDVEVLTRESDVLALLATQQYHIEGTIAYFLVDNNSARAFAVSSKLVKQLKADHLIEQDKPLHPTLYRASNTGLAKAGVL